MYYKSILPQDKSWIDYLQQRIALFDVRSFEFAMESKQFSEPDIESITTEIQTYRLRMSNEYNRLARQVKEFVYTYALDKDDQYEDALKLMKKLRSSLSGAKKVFAKFCPRAHRENFFHKIGNKPVSVFDYALFARNEIQLSLFEMVGYPPCVNDLYNEMSEFFFVLTSTLQLCKDVLKKVEETRQNQDLVNGLLGQLRTEVLSTLGDTTFLIPIENACFLPENNKAIALSKQYPDIPTFAPHGYHKFNREEMKNFFIYEELKRTKNNDCTPLELLIFKEEQFVPRYRAIVQNFDSFVQEEYSGKKIPAKTIYFFLRYINLEQKFYGKALNYFKDTYQGDYSLPAADAVKTAKRKFEKEENEEYNDFANRIIESLLSKKTDSLSKIS